MGFSAENITLTALVPESRILWNVWALSHKALAPRPAVNISADVSIALAAAVPVARISWNFWDVALRAALPAVSVVQDVGGAVVSHAATRPLLTVTLTAGNQAWASQRAAAPRVVIKIKPAIVVAHQAPAPVLRAGFGASNIIKAYLRAPTPLLRAFSDLEYAGGDIEVLAVNALNGAVSTLVALPLGSFALHKGAVLAAGPTGVIQLGGTTDDGSAIAVDVAFHKSTLGSTKLKRVRRMVVVGRDTGYDPTLTVASGDVSSEHDCVFVSGHVDQGVEIPGHRTVVGDTVTIGVESRKPVSMELIDVVFKKIRG